jgi:hypothetical protein
MPIFDSITKLVSPVLDKIFPDAKDRQEAKMKLIELEQNGEFKELELRLEAIKSESQSDDPLTSRARPFFLYVIYIFLLSAIPFSVLFVFEPEGAKLAVEGMKMWLEAIPNELLTLFGVGYLGYTGARTWDKTTKAKHK